MRAVTWSGVMPNRSGHIFYGWYVVTGAFAAWALAFGVLYAFGAFFTPLSKTFDANRASVAGLFGVTLGLANALGWASGWAADRFGARRLVLVGGVVIGVGLLLASRATSLWHLYVTYSLGVGLGLACITVPTTETVQHWFVRRRGLATGIAVGGGAAGNLAAPPLFAALLRVWSWQTLFVATAVVVAAGIALASCLLDRAPERRGLRPDGDSGSGTPEPAGGMAIGAVIRTPTFWALYAAVCVGSLGAFVPFVHLVPDAESHGIHPVTAALLMGMIGAGSLAGRLLIGAAADRVGRRRAFGVSLLGMASFLAWWLISEQVWSLGVFALGFGLGYGSFLALSPALAADYFGAHHAGVIIGVLYTALVPGCVLGPTLAGWAYDLSDSYMLPIAASTTTMLVAAAIAWTLPRPSTVRTPGITAATEPAA